jgi:excisionase family DNA binding protein
VTTYQRPYPPESLTTQQAAVVLGVSVDTVMRWCSQGLLAEIEAPSGRRPRLFRQADVENLAAQLDGRPMARQWRGLDLSHIALDDPLRERFWAKTGEDGPTPAHRPELGPCREWTEYRDGCGYGRFVLRRGDFRVAQIVSYALTQGPVPAGMYVCHRCDNPPCVRPDHLFLGSASDNSLDMFAKGRQGSRHPGSERANARLNEDDIRAIRSVPRYYGRGRDLARKYGVSDTTIRRIISGDLWRHVA